MMFGILGQAGPPEWNLEGWFDPIILPVYFAIGLALLLTATGSVAENLITSRYKKMSQLIGNVGTALLMSLLLYGFLRVFLKDSLQTSCVSAVGGIYGRDHFQKAVGDILSMAWVFVFGKLRQLFGIKGSSDDSSP